VGTNVMVTGMVLTAMPISEYDKRITILTLERGKITAFARGARRPNSTLLAACNPFSFGQFEVYEGRTSYNVVRAEIKNYFTELTTDLNDTYYGFYFLEMAEYYAQENSDDREMLKLLYQSLKALGKKNFDNRLVRVIYELKMMVLNGVYPNLFSCQKCGKKEPMQFFSVQRAGLLCDSCSETEHGRRLDASTIYTMQYIITTEAAKLFHFAVSEKVLFELIRTVREFREKYAPHTFKSEQFLEGIF
jgi:DNA repair protein RecO (recombination protein O)